MMTEELVLQTVHFEKAILKCWKIKIKHLGTPLLWMGLATWMKGLCMRICKIRPQPVELFWDFTGHLITSFNQQWFSEIILL